MTHFLQLLPHSSRNAAHPAQPLKAHRQLLKPTRAWEGLESHPLIVTDPVSEVFCWLSKTLTFTFSLNQHKVQNKYDRYPMLLDVISFLIRSKTSHLWSDYSSISVSKSNNNFRLWVSMRLSQCFMVNPRQAHCSGYYARCMDGYFANESGLLFRSASTACTLKYVNLWHHKVWELLALAGLESLLRLPEDTPGQDSRAAVSWLCFLPIWFLKWQNNPVSHPPAPPTHPVVPHLKSENSQQSSVTDTQTKCDTMQKA